ncbi:MAG: hypothetical protein AAF934_03300 [Bacteroidota bacterium]
MKKTNKMDAEAAKRIQRAEAQKNNGKVSKDSFASRAQRAAEKNSGEGN